MAKLVAERRAAAPPPPAPTGETLAPAAWNPAPSAAAELSAGGLLWRAFLSWLRDLTGNNLKGKKENPR
jgi:hypothetical protein